MISKDCKRLAEVDFPLLPSANMPCGRSRFAMVTHQPCGCGGPAVLWHHVERAAGPLPEVHHHFLLGDGALERDDLARLLSEIRDLQSPNSGE